MKPGSKKGTDPDALIKQPYIYDEPTGGFLHFSIDPSAVLMIRHHDDTGKVLNTVKKTAP